MALVLGWALHLPAATPSTAPAPEADKSEAKEKEAGSAKMSDAAKASDATKASDAAKTKEAAGNSRRSPRGATFDDLKLELKKDQAFKSEMLTDKVKQLDGKWIKIRGYILPSFQDKDIKQFVLMRNNQECCFGPGAALHDAIVVELEGDTRTDFTTRPVEVSGKFAVKELVFDGKQVAIYRINGNSVK